MPPAQHPQPLPSFNLAIGSDHHKTMLPNLSYPSRPNTHIPWFGSSAPLLFAKTTQPETTFATSTPNVQAPTTTNMYFDTCSVPDAFNAIGRLVWHALSMIIQTLKLIKQRLFGVRATGPSATASA